MSSPLVSIMIPVYNRKELLVPCIESALSQTVNDLEVVVVDNASTDGTWDVCQEFAKRDSRVRIFRNDTNIGPVRNWKRCIDEARGVYGKILWSDDLIAPSFIEKTMPILESNNEVGFVFSGTIVFNEQTKRNSKHYFIGETGIYMTKDFIEGTLCGEYPCPVAGIYPVSPCCAIFRLKDMRKNLIIDVPNKIDSDFSMHAIGNDMLLFLLTANNYKYFAFICEALSFFRDHKGSISCFTETKKLLFLYNIAKMYFIENYVNDIGLTKKFNIYFNKNWGDMYEKEVKKIKSSAYINTLSKKRKNLAESWLKVPPELLEKFYSEDMGNVHRKLMQSGIRNEVLTDEEKIFLQYISKELTRRSSVDPVSAMNYLLAIMLYLPSGSLKIDNAETSLPNWLLEGYKKFFCGTVEQQANINNLYSKSNTSSAVHAGLNEDLVEELIETFKKLPFEIISDSPPSERNWKQNINRLRDLVLTANPREFLRWDIILETMFVSSNTPYIIEELNYLKKTYDWNTRWLEAIEENHIGSPTPFYMYPSSSGNLIHHAYHISKFEEHFGEKVDTIDFIFEFGGGYGSMCRLIHKLDFKGKYLIFDLPHFSALQRYYLKSIGIPIFTPDSFIFAKDGVCCISDFGTLRELLSIIVSDNTNSLFLATWSISETPLNIRNSILPLLSGFNSFLIAYQRIFEEVDNIKYFEEYAKKIYHHEVRWTQWEIKHIPNNYYLIGRKMNKMLDIKSRCSKYDIVSSGVIDVGAHEGEKIKVYQEMGVKRLIFIEANPVVFERLKANINGISNMQMIAINCAMSNQNGSIILHVTSMDQSSSVLPLKRHKEIYPDITETRQISVPSRTLDTLIQELKINPADFNILNIDIQGAELLALQGATHCLKHIDAINTKVNYEELYEGCALIDEMDEFLKRFGFERVATTTPYHPSWGDAFYVKKPVITMSSLGQNGGFGNQIFQYAFLKTYSKKYNLQVETPMWIGQYLFGCNDSKISRHLPEIKEVFNSDIKEAIIPNSKKNLKNVDFHGFFQYHTTYYLPYKDYFRSLFKPVPQLSDIMKKLMDKLRSKGKTIISIHIRRGDYEYLQHRRKDYGYECFFITPSTWYKEWLAGLWETIESPILFVASDELEKVIYDFNEYRPYTYKDLGIEIPQANFYPDFYILSHSDILAISNSTFSFTASMLNEHGKMFFRPHLPTKKLIPFDPWNSVPMFRDV